MRILVLSQYFPLGMGGGITRASNVVNGLLGKGCEVAFFGVWMLQIYAVERYIVTNIALASVALVLVGFFMLSTAITLYAITQITEKMNGRN
jgi:hypothetical membrane protein